MPQLRCTECEHELYETSRLAIGRDCPECEEGEMVEITDDDVLDEPEPLVKTRVGEGAQVSLARAAARKVLEDQGIVRPPVRVEDIAARAGFAVVESKTLGRLSGRLREDRIEVAPSGRNRRRFVIAHELGHHFLGKPHGSSRYVEQEVNAFAGELLVPGPWLLTAIKEMDEARLLAVRFQVSTQVLDIAAGNHGCRDRINWDI